MGKRFDTLLKVFDSRKYSIENLEEVVESLRMVCNNSVQELSVGLCSTCLFPLPPLYRTVLFQTWKKFSGDTLYPIFDPLCTDYKKAESQYYNLPKYSGNYGDLRIQLAKHCIKKISKDIKKLKKLGYK